MKITFIPLAKSHFPLLLKWLEAPHVKAWWDQDVTYTLDLVHEKYSSYVKGYKLVEALQKPIKSFIIHHNQNPVGYIQIYNESSITNVSLIISVHQIDELSFAVIGGEIVDDGIETRR